VNKVLDEFLAALKSLKKTNCFAVSITSMTIVMPRCRRSLNPKQNILTEGFTLVGFDEADVLIRTSPSTRRNFRQTAIS